VEREAGIAARAKTIIRIIGVAINVHVFAEAQRVHEGASGAGGADTLEPGGAVGV
jgi:hypothetical protein